MLRLNYKGMAVESITTQLIQELEMANDCFALHGE